MPHPLRIAVVGAGYWGPNVVRTLTELPDCAVAYVCDRAPGRLRYIGGRFPRLRLTARLEDRLADPSVGAGALVAPLSSHPPPAGASPPAGHHRLLQEPPARPGGGAGAA